MHFCRFAPASLVYLTRACPLRSGFAVDLVRMAVTAPCSPDRRPLAGASSPAPAPASGASNC
eukprot:4490968-Pleurochrysis_carterae.AAC.1